MYHHVEDLERATAEKHAQLTVGTGTFRTQMQYLKDKGYTVISMGELQQFFDTSTSLPAKPVLLTFDDGYSDFGSDALPILKEFGYHATLFLPTGLTENPGYLTWNTVNDASISKVLIANHTWSHHSVATDKSTVEKEITTADSQLAQRGFNSQKVFAYPYGNSNQMAVEVLQKLGYNLAFTTIHGATLCKQQRLVLPRIRIGNSSLAAYGL
jgi:peptidoglycan/xylan/chitin deacetylase (PgdA/CDA1 family)